MPIVKSKRIVGFIYIIYIYLHIYINILKTKKQLCNCPIQWQSEYFRIVLKQIVKYLMCCFKKKNVKRKVYLSVYKNVVHAYSKYINFVFVWKLVAKSG